MVRYQYMVAEETGQPKLVRINDESVFVRVGRRKPTGIMEGMPCDPIIDPEFLDNPEDPIVDEPKVTTTMPDFRGFWATVFGDEVVTPEQLMNGQCWNQRWPDTTNAFVDWTPNG